MNWIRKILGLKTEKHCAIHDVMGSSDVRFTKDEVINFAKYVWYTKSLDKTEKGLTHYFKEWLEMGKNYCP